MFIIMVKFYALGYDKDQGEKMAQNWGYMKDNDKQQLYVDYLGYSKGQDGKLLGYGQGYNQDDNGDLGQGYDYGYGYGQGYSYDYEYYYYCINQIRYSHACLAFSYI